MDESVFFLTIAELNAKLRAKEFSVVELTRAYCDRLEKLGPRYNALALLLRDSAIRKAKDVDGDLKRERYRGPLQGIPYGAKDLLSFAGQPTTWGAKPYAGQVFNYTATVIQRLDRVGAVLSAKLAMVELAGGGGYRFAAASMFGPGLNPWDRSRWSGGSSNGSGSAVAAGLAPFALGSETVGSILTPSAFCGVTGLRPTYGLVSRHGAMALSWTLDKIGPMCRSAEDCGLALQVIAGSDGNDPGSAGKSFYYTPQYARKLKDIRVAFAPSDFAEWAEPATRPDFQKAVATIRELGVQMRESELFDMPFGPVTSAVLGAEASSNFEGLIESGKVDELADKKQIAGLKAGLEIASRDYLKAMRIRSLMQFDFRKMFAEVDVLLAPALNRIAPKVSEPLDGSGRASPRPEPPKGRGFRSLVSASNLAGLPALCLPCGFADGMPIAIQLVGPPFSENTLLAIGREFQKRTDWHRRHPKL